MARRWVRNVIAVAVVASLAALAAAHGGGTDSQGGHNDSQAGTYHFHRGPLVGKSFPSKAAATRALQEQRGAANPSSEPPDPKAALARATTAQKVDALIALLTRKRLISEAELAASIKEAR